MKSNEPDEVVFKVTGATFFKLNWGHAAMYEVEYDFESLILLEYAISKMILPPIDRLGILLSIEKSTNLTPKQLETVLTFFVREENKVIKSKRDELSLATEGVP